MSRKCRLCSPLLLDTRAATHSQEMDAVLLLSLVLPSFAFIILERMDDGGIEWGVR